MIDLIINNNNNNNNNNDNNNIGLSGFVSNLSNDNPKHCKFEAGSTGFRYYRKPWTRFVRIMIYIDLVGCSVVRVFLCDFLAWWLMFSIWHFKSWMCSFIVRLLLSLFDHCCWYLWFTCESIESTMLLLLSLLII